LDDPVVDDLPVTNVQQQGTQTGVRLHSGQDGGDDNAEARLAL
jgi:hypothetical protein